MFHQEGDRQEVASIALAPADNAVRLLQAEATAPGAARGSRQRHGAGYCATAVSKALTIPASIRATATAPGDLREIPWRP